MISSNFSLGGFKVEDVQARIEHPNQGKDFWTMPAGEFFKWLFKCNGKNKLPKDFVLKPIQYDEERKYRIVTMVEQ